MAIIKKKTSKDKGASSFAQAQARGQVFANARGKNPATIQNGKLTLVSPQKGSIGLLEGRQPSDKVAGTTRVAPNTPIVTPFTKEERAKGLLEADYQKNKAIEASLFGDTTSPDSYEARTKQRAQQLIEEGLRSQSILEKNKQSQIDSFKQSQKSMESSTLAEQQALTAGGREAPTSYSNISAKNTLAQNLAARTAELQNQRETYNLQYAQAEDDLKSAMASGRQDLIDAARQNMAAAELQVNQIESDIINSQIAQSEESRAAQESKAKLADAGIGSILTMAQNNVTLDSATLQSLGEQYGLDTDTMLGIYDGAQAIYADKAMDAETKAYNLQILAEDTKNYLQGIQTEEAKAVNSYLQLVKSGNYTEQELSDFAIAMGISDDRNPVYQADLALKQAEAKIKQAEANGQLINPLDQQALIKAQYENWALLGFEPGVIPQGGSYGVTANGDGSISVNAEVGFKAGQCGRFVNDVFGQKMMGDSYESKMAWVDPTIKIPEAGMAFVMETESPYGHTGIVESVNPDTGMMTVIDSNWGLDEKVQRREIPISSVSGFVRPPNSISAGAELTLMDVPEDVRSAVTTKANQFDGEQLVKNFQVVQEGYNYMTSLDPENLTSTDNQSIIYAFAKIMDPNSVVRESEYDTVQKYAQSLASTYGFNAERILSNTEFLSKEAVQNMINTVQDRYDSSARSYDNLRSEYARTINNLAGGIDIADSILQNYATSSTADTQDDGGWGEIDTESSDDILNLW